MKPLQNILCFLFISWLNSFVLIELHAQKQSKQDARIVANYIKQDNIKWIRETLKSNEAHTIPSVRSLWRDERLYDSLLEISSTIWDNGKVFYASDGAFKVFQMDDSQSPHHCNYSTKCFLHLKSGKVIYPNGYDELKGLSINPIVSIVKFTRNTYGILQEYEGCGNVHSRALTVTQIKIKNNDFTYLPIESKAYQPIDFNKDDNKKGSFVIWTTFYYVQPNNTYLKFDPVKKKIKYSYVMDSEETRWKNLNRKLKPRENQVLQVYGEVKVVNGKLCFTKEHWKFIKDDMSKG